MKAKSHSSAKKRIKITGSGKFMLPKSNKSHLLINKSRKAKNRNQYGQVADASNVVALKRLLTGAF